LRWQRVVAVDARETATMEGGRAYDVVISFAGEDRAHARDLADALNRRGVAPFYDEYEKAALWGKNLYTHLSGVYQDQAQYCVMFLSRHYAAQVWTNHEREAAQARAFKENREYILPVRLDDTEIPGMLPTVGYVSCPPETADSIADLVVVKLRSITDVGRTPSPDDISDTAAETLAAEIGREVEEAAGLLRRDTTLSHPLPGWVKSIGPKKAPAWQQAARRGDPGAQWLLSLCHVHGAGVVQDIQEAARLIRQAADQGLPIAMAYLGWFYHQGSLGFKDHAGAVSWSRRAADLGEPLAQFLLGTLYLEGVEVEQDLHRAVQWLSKAASARFALAQLVLGGLYMAGDQVTRDPSKGFEMLREAAEQGDAKAECEVGLGYFQGAGVAEDHRAAFKWFRRSANQGYADAQLLLGFAYAEGRGVGHSPGQAVKWFRRAAEQGQAEAQNQLAVCYQNGKGVPADRSQAIYWYRKAAEQGHQLAEANLNQPLNRLMDWLR
jgi:TPR repeat protein